MADNRYRIYIISIISREQQWTKILVTIFFCQLKIISTYILIDTVGIDRFTDRIFRSVRLKLRVSNESRILKRETIRGSAAKSRMSTRAAELLVFVFTEPRHKIFSQVRFLF